MTCATSTGQLSSRPVLRLLQRGFASESASHDLRHCPAQMRQVYSKNHPAALRLEMRMGSGSPLSSIALFLPKRVVGSQVYSGARDEESASGL